MLEITSVMPAPGKPEWACKVTNWLIDFEAENGCNIQKKHITPNSAKINGIYALDRNRLIGGLLFTLHNDWIFINIAYVQPKYRGSGLFSLMVGQLEKYGRKRGVAGMHVSTFDFEAPHIYEHMGFVRGCVMPDCPRGNTSIDFVKLLGAAKTESKKKGRL